MELTVMAVNLSTLTMKSSPSPSYIVGLNSKYGKYAQDCTVNQTFQWRNKITLDWRLRICVLWSRKRNTCCLNMGTSRVRPFHWSWGSGHKCNTWEMFLSPLISIQSLCFFLWDLSVAFLSPLSFPLHTVLNTNQQQPSSFCSNDALHIFTVPVM